jgi:1,2-phenylacetyl-CoA epoxidase PaaB subunit
MSNLSGNTSDQSPPPTSDEGEVFEVFQQDQKDPSPHHGGNVRAPDSELAIHYAREFYGRRQESSRLWIIPRSALLEVRTQTPLPPAGEMFGAGEAQVIAAQSFAVFGQKQAGRPLVWLHDLDEMALEDAEEAARHAAQNIEGGYVRLWICPRSAISELSNHDLLRPPLDRSYRRLDGYNIREKLRIARQRVQAEKELPS